MSADGRLDGEAVDRVLVAAGHRRTARPPLPAGLTAHEAEVLRLLALGLTVRQISDELVIPRRPRTITSSTSTRRSVYRPTARQRCSPSTSASGRRTLTRRTRRGLQSRSPINIRRSAGDWIQLPPALGSFNAVGADLSPIPFGLAICLAARAATAAPLGTARGRRCRRRRRAAAVTATQPSAFSASPKRSGPRGPPTLPWG